MNTSYKSIWNGSLGTYVAASEAATASGCKVASARRSRRSPERAVSSQLALEQRIVFDAALPATVMETTAETVSTQDAWLQATDAQGVEVAVPVDAFPSATDVDPVVADADPAEARATDASDAVVGGDSAAVNEEEVVASGAESASPADSGQGETDASAAVEPAGDGLADATGAGDRIETTVITASERAGELTTVPATVDGISTGRLLNSLAVNQTAGLICCVANDTIGTNKALFACDFTNNVHILVDADLTINDAGVGNMMVGATGVGDGAAAGTGIESDGTGTTATTSIATTNIQGAETRSGNNYLLGTTSQQYDPAKNTLLGTGRTYTTTEGSTRTAVDVTQVGSTHLTHDFGLNNRPPLHVVPGAQTVADGSAGDRLTITGFTVDGDTMVYTADETATITGVGALTINADGSYRFAPAAASTTEDTALVFSRVNGNGIALTDPGNTHSVVELTLAIDPSIASLQLSGITGLVSVSGDGSSQIILTGTIGSVNAALEGLTLRPTDDYNSASTTGLNITLKRPLDLGLENAGFELTDYPDANVFRLVDAAEVPGWDTSATDNLIEIWDDGFNGVPAFEGNQFAELNATQDSTLSQTFTPALAGGELELSFAHRGRSGDDTMNVTAIDLGTDGVLGGGDDTVLFSQNHTTGNTAWQRYQANLGSATGNPVVFQFAVVSTATGNNTVGNFLDAVSITGSATTTDTVQISITPVQDTVTDNLGTNEETPITFNVLAGAGGASADNFEGSPAVTSYTDPSHGTLVQGANGAFTYTPELSYTGSDSFTYTVTSPAGVTETEVVSITVTGVNAAPVDGDETSTVTEDTPLRVAAGSAGDLLANTTDVDGDRLTITGFTVDGDTTVYTADETATITGVGALTINADGSYRFAPAAGHTGTIPVATYTVSDGNGGTDSSTLTLTMAAVNDAPVATDDGPATTAYNTAVTGNVLPNDGDVDGDTLTVISFTVDGVQGSISAGATASIPGVGALLINPDGRFTFTPASGYAGPVPVVTYVVSDGQGGTDTAQLSFADVPAAPAPAPEDVTRPTWGEAPEPSAPAPAVIAPKAPSALHVLYAVADANSGRNSSTAQLGAPQAAAPLLGEAQGRLPDSLLFTNNSHSEPIGLIRERGLGEVQAVRPDLYVQLAVRHQPISTDPSLWVQHAVRASQLESQLRAAYLEADNAAAPGNSGLIDPFALGAPKPEDPAIKVTGGAQTGSRQETVARTVAEPAPAPEAIKPKAPAADQPVDPPRAAVGLRHQLQCYAKDRAVGARPVTRSTVFS